MAGKLNWNDEAFKSKVRRTMERRIVACAIVVEDHAKRLLSVEGTGGTNGGKRVYGSNPSKPGEPPHKQKGDLRASVTHERVGTELKSRVGTGLKYGRWLELGTANMAARPWLRRALLDQARRIRRILTAKIH